MSWNILKTIREFLMLNRTGPTREANDMNVERRKYSRHQVLSKSIFLYSNHSTMQGWLKDIGFGGIAFEYIPNDNCEIQPEIKLILMGDEIPFYFPEITYKVIHDTKISKNDGAVKKNGTRRCGLQYKKLDAGLQDRLKVQLSNKIMML